MFFERCLSNIYPDLASRKSESRVLIRAEVQEDTSYLSHYLDLHGSVIELEPLSDGQTKVTLRVTYERKLDPAWYFGPLERFGVKQTAGYLIDKVLDNQEDNHHG